MRVRTATRATIAALVATATFAAPTLATAADTTVSFTVAASGALAVAQSTSTATLTDGGGSLGFSALNPGAVAGTLPETTVTDTRGTLLAPWTVTVSATGDFENASDSGVTVGAENARVYLDAADLLTLTGTVLSGALTGATVTGAELTVGANDLGDPYTLIQGTSTLGNGSVTYTPAMSVTVPAGTPAGTYSTVVQQTVS